MPKKKESAAQKDNAKSSGLDARVGQRTRNKQPSKRRSTGAQKSTVAGSKKNVSKTGAIPNPATGNRLHPAEEEIRVLAYFIAERRHRLGLPGDSNSDWLEAKRQLNPSGEPRPGMEA